MTRKATRLAAAALVLAVPLALTAGPALAEGDPAAAHPIVAEHCATCHEVPGFKARFEKAQVPAPPFQTIADDPDKYPEPQLRAFLQKPHFPMGSLILSAKDIDNLLAFIESLRKPAQ